MMEQSCFKCGRETYKGVCNFCKHEEKKEKSKDDTRQGCCHYAVNGEYCPLQGSMSTETHGYTTKWFCNFHIRCSNPEEGKNVIDWAKSNFKDIMMTRKFQVFNDLLVAGEVVFSPNDQKMD